MSGSGNDFIVIDNRKKIVSAPSAFAKKYCHRKFGVGADGILLVEKSAKHNFTMKYYNSDGSRASFCGNGSRCISLFAYLNKIAPRKMTFDSDAGVISAEVAGSGTAQLCQDVKVRMPDPKNIKLDLCVSVEGKKYNSSFADTGVPHTVIFVEDIENVDVEALGRKIRFHEMFKPSGTNVNFVKVLNKSKISLRTYERGVEGETLACGTGTVASSVISILKTYVKSPLSAITRGGETLKVYYDGQTAHFQGKVSVVFEGKLTSI
jgi:diaminopimelate epimerase